MNRSSSSRRQPVDAAAAVGRSGEPGLLAGGFEHRLALQVVEPLAGEDGGDGVGDALDAAHGGFAEWRSECKLMPAAGKARQAPPSGLAGRARASFPLPALWKAQLSAREARHAGQDPAPGRTG